MGRDCRRTITPSRVEVRTSRVQKGVNLPSGGCPGQISTPPRLQSRNKLAARPLRHTPK
jgi:hypothetical protein